MIAAGMIADWLRALATGVQFLTRIPVPGGASAIPSSYQQDVPRMLALFPVIGAGIGAVTASVLWLAAQLWPFPLAVLIALAMEAMLTGALHEDAVADVCDAFGGGATQQDILRILKDSRIGSYGLVGLGFAVALRAGGLIASGGPARAALVLVMSGVLARVVILVVMAWVPPVAGRAGLAGGMGMPLRWKTVLGGIALAMPIFVVAAVADPRALGFGVLMCALFVLWFAALVRRRIGGGTGDCFGCAAYAAMVLVTLAFAASR